MTLTLVWIPGHMCGDWLYAPLMGRWPGPERVAETGLDADLGAMAERLLAATPGRLALAGLSMGGMVAMEAMARATDRLAGALLMDTNPTAARERELAGWRAALEGIAAAGSAAHVAAFVPRFYAHDRQVAARLGAWTEAKMRAVPAEVVAAQIRAIAGRRAMIPLLEGCTLPVEIVVGAEDAVCPPRLHRPLAEALGDAALTEIPGTGHIASLEAPEAVRDRLDRLVARIGP